MPGTSDVLLALAPASSPWQTAEDIALLILNQHSMLAFSVVVVPI